MTIFLSYARADGTESAELLRNRLQDARHVAWVDRHDIPGGAEWKTEVAKALLSVDAFILLISPAAMQSEPVRQELEIAASLQKHIIPILAVATPPELLPPAIAALNYRSLITDPLQAFAQVIGDLTALDRAVAREFDSLLQGTGLAGGVLPQ